MRIFRLSRFSFDTTTMAIAMQSSKTPKLPLLITKLFKTLPCNTCLRFLKNLRQDANVDFVLVLSWISWNSKFNMHGGI